MSQYLHPFLQTSFLDQASFATLISSAGCTIYSPRSGFTEQSQLKLLCLDIETTIKIKLGGILEKLNQSHNRRKPASLDEGAIERCASTQFLEIPKKHLIELQKHLERCGYVIPVFRLNSAKNDLNLIKRYLLSVLVDVCDIEATISKISNQFISFKFSDIQLLDTLKILGGATDLDSILKAYKTSKAKRFFVFDLCEQFHYPNKMQNTDLYRMTPFTVNFVAKILLKQIKLTILTY